ncbi:MAG: SIR2 family protein [Clostridia bacterium]|nr:SIR2 family protein [Clostridia bacterium]
MQIDREDLLKEKLLTGINLFTGAGFSCLPNEDGVSLPVVSELCVELCKKFNLPHDTFGNDLEALCALADGNELQEFLRQKFHVDKINSKYLLLNKINLLSYITTNIDNIIHLAVEADTRYYLNSITYYGAARKSQAEICYIPLHGEVTNNESKLYFGKFELAIADRANSDLFQTATVKMKNSPVLFWGYGFHDSGVLKMVQKLMSYGTQDIWIQCMPSDDKQIKLFKGLGCNIIVGDTNELFDWIASNVKESENTSTSADIKDNQNLKRYFIPSINQVPAVPANDFYIKGFTQWYSVLTKQAVELDIVNDVYNKHLKNKNVIIVGTDFSGKSTALMQLALKINHKNKLFVKDLNLEKSKHILKNLAETEAVVFVDNCEEDLMAYKLLAESSNILTIATATDYTYEASKHLLEDIPVQHFYIEDFTQEQARRFYNAIDSKIRKSTFNYKDSESEKFSILEMMLKNISNPLGMERIKNLLLKILDRSSQAFETVALSCYLSGNNSALSTDILFSYFDCHSYEETQRYVNEANGLMRELHVSVDSCDDDQDYYDIRSKLFLYHCKKSLTEDARLKQAYSNVINNFFERVPCFKIYRYNLFKRSAYDAKLFYLLFKDKANEIYDKLYDYEPNPYTLQQWALCRAYLKQFKEAFSDIDKALRQKPNNFSIKNTSAIILFEANRGEYNDTGKQKRIEAMDILSECYKNDKRKTYHANRFAEFAIEIFEIDQDPQFIEQAKKWIDEVLANNEGTLGYTKKYQRKLKEILNDICKK